MSISTNNNSFLFTNSQNEMKFSITQLVTCVEKEVRYPDYIESFKRKENNCRIRYNGKKLETKIYYPFFQLENCFGTKCKQNEYQCYFYSHCIPIENVCDGLTQCYYGDDEIDCGSFSLPLLLRSKFLNFLFFLRKLFTERLFQLQR